MAEHLDANGNHIAFDDVEQMDIFRSTRGTRKGPGGLGKKREAMRFVRVLSLVGLLALAGCSG